MLFRSPLAAVFQPLIETDDRVVETESVMYYRAIKTSKLKPKTRDTLLEVFVNWLEQRLPHKGQKEIEIMLLGELPALEDTQSGKDLIRIGEVRGEARGEARGKILGEARGKMLGLDQAVVVCLESRFGRLTKALRARIERLSADEATEVLTQMATWNKLQDAKDWLNNRGR